MSAIKINLENKIKNMKIMHATGQPPLGGRRGDIFGPIHYLSDIGVPYSRLHDVGGAYGANRYVDIPNIFRNFDADENDPANYDFTFTDKLITALVEHGVEPYYRLGITIENQASIKAYYTAPPSDYQKWARICEHIIAHYNEGWADGFEYNITYWEIWNEPDDGNGLRSPEPDGTPYTSQMWDGTKEEYYELYDVTAKYLKARFPNIKVGGYASCGFNAILDDEEDTYRKIQYKYQLDFFYGFMDYVKEHNSPIDFFSYHSYSRTNKIIKYDEWLHKTLTEYGYGDIEIHLNEWNPIPAERGTAHHSAEITGVMISLQKGYTDMLMLYDSRFNAGTYCAFFDPMTYTPFHAYYALAAFNTLYKLGTQVEAESDTEELYVLAASNGEKHAILISNLTDKDQILDFEGVDLKNARWSLIDQTRLLSWSPALKNIKKNDVLLIEF